MPRIYVIAPNCFYTYELPVTPGAEVLIGTAPQCHLLLPGVEGLAGVHACIVCQGADYMISDMGSPMGTFANGTPVRSVFLMPGVEYRMGSLLISLAVEGMPPPVAPMPVQPWGMPQPMIMQQPLYPAAPPPTNAPPAASPAPKSRVKRLNREELNALRSKFNFTQSKKFPFGKLIFLGLVLLCIAFFADWLPIHRSDAQEYLNALVRDMDKTSSGKKAKTPAPQAAPKAAPKAAPAPAAPPVPTPAPKPPAPSDGFEPVGDEED